MSSQSTNLFWGRPGVRGHRCKGARKKGAWSVLTRSVVVSCASTDVFAGQVDIVPGMPKPGPSQHTSSTRAELESGRNGTSTQRSGDDANRSKKRRRDISSSTANFDEVSPPAAKSRKVFFDADASGLRKTRTGATTVSELTAAGIAPTAQVLSESNWNALNDSPTH